MTFRALQNDAIDCCSVLFSQAGMRFFPALSGTMEGSHEVLCRGKRLFFTMFADLDSTRLDLLGLLARSDLEKIPRDPAPLASRFVAVLLVVFVPGEPLTLAIVAGFLLIIAGSWLSTTGVLQWKFAPSWLLPASEGEKTEGRERRHRAQRGMVE